MKANVRRTRRRMDAIDVIALVFMTIFTLVIAIPFYTTIVTSILTNTSYTRNPFQLIPDEVTFSNYVYIFQNSSLLTGYENTLIVTAVGTAYGLLISLMTAYGLSFKGFPGKRLLTYLVVIPMYVSGGLLPTYLNTKDLGLMNSLWAIILQVGITPFNIIIIKNSIEQLPGEITEAARIDGAGEFKAFFKVVLPLIKPTLATFGLFIAVAYWNEWYGSMLYLNSNSQKTLQLILRNIVSQGSQDTAMAASAVTLTNVFSQGIKTAAVVVTMLPIMCLYPFLQKYFAKGLLVGAVKM